MSRQGVGEIATVLCVQPVFCRFRDDFEQRLLDKFGAEFFIAQRYQIAVLPDARRVARDEVQV